MSTGRATIDGYILPTIPRASRFAAVGPCRDRQTLYHYTEHALHTMCAVPITHSVPVWMTEMLSILQYLLHCSVHAWFISKRDKAEATALLCHGVHHQAKVPYRPTVFEKWYQLIFQDILWYLAAKHLSNQSTRSNIKSISLQTGVYSFHKAVDLRQLCHSKSILLQETTDAIANLFKFLV